MSEPPLIRVKLLKCCRAEASVLQLMVMPYWPAAGSSLLNTAVQCPKKLKLLFKRISVKATRLFILPSIRKWSATQRSPIPFEMKRLK